MDNDSLIADNKSINSDDLSPWLLSNNNSKLNFKAPISTKGRRL